MDSDPAPSRRSPVLPVLVALTIITVVSITYSLLHDDEHIAPCEPNAVPAEAYEIIDTIHTGGPFTYPDNDGTRFGNYEEELPIEAPGYYREYTVSTPGLGHRGERRIVTGGGTPEDPDIYYYTADHYASFCEVTDAE